MINELYLLKVSWYFNADLSEPYMFDLDIRNVHAIHLMSLTVHIRHKQDNGP